MKGASAPFYLTLMNNYDQLMYLILNRILPMFGVRIVNEKKVVFLYHIENYTDPYAPTRSAHVVKLSDNANDVFGFLNMDYASYKKQQFKTIFEFTDWITTHCKYLTVEIVKSIEKEVQATPEDKRPDVLKAAGRFAETVKIGHIILRDFQYTPVVMYQNLKESIVRSFFDDASVEKQFVDLKLAYLKDTELPNKFSPKHVINWIPTLKSNSTLTGIVTRSFVDYVTQNNVKKFPRFLIDTDPGIVKKEVLSYYYNIFPNSAVYREYVLAHPEMNEVK
jgi:hypothetical protein